MNLPDPNTPWKEMLGILLCLFGSAFFSGAETALTRFPDNKARHLIETDPRKWGLLEFWLAHKRRIVSALLVGNNIVNIIVSILGYRVALHFLPQYAEAVSVFGLTLILLIFGEITPKSIALQMWETLAVPMLRVVWLVEKLLYPIAWPLSRIPLLLLGNRGAGIMEPKVTEDEIGYHIRLGFDNQVFEEKEQGELLRSAVEFPETLVKEVMIPRTAIFGIDIATSFTDAVKAIIDHGHSRIPVYRGNLDDVAGLLYAKDLLKCHTRAKDRIPASIETLVRKPIFAPDTQKVSDLLAMMKRKGQHMAIVVDEFGGTAGLITLEDIIEELVGDIRDEYDDEADITFIRKIEESAWQVDARISIYDLRDEIGVMLPDTGEYESLGGFVIAHHGAIPEKGTVVQTDSAIITVLASDARHVEKCEVRVLNEDKPSHD
ncbi:MAG: hemolysin family protein [Myxococcota bacterium]|jgi:CBS domain containing-hemolysin-like protein|nr:hemolysin family protein [Myxococcota bacterium]